MLAWVGCWVLCIGFVGASSGWTWMLARWGDDRPAWSVCGQDMCACVPTTPMEPECPLCELGETGSAGCSAETGSQVPERGAPILRTLSDADDAACSMMIAVFVLFAGQQHATTNRYENATGWTIEESNRLASLPIGVPTPPPRHG